MHPVEAYLRDLRDIRSSGAAVPETSYYGALANLLNAIGKTLKPRVNCIINIQNRGAGIPDGGLFTADQLQTRVLSEPFLGQLPGRGAIEAKGTSASVRAVAGSQQVRKYLGTYGMVLVTNLRDFLLVGRDALGQTIELEMFQLAADEAMFWAAVQEPQAMAAEHGERLAEYLRRVMLHNAPLHSPEDVARFLASYARDARVRVEQAEIPALATVRAALEQALGIRFEGQRGEHFFRSTLVQTLFYGVFSAWVLWSKQQAESKPAARFDWRLAVWSLQVPMIRTLFEQLATPSTVEQLDLAEVLDWTGAALNRVQRDSFFARFEEGHAVQYFYEPFLEAFDPELRKQLGVWYTPPEIIRYMVARVDTVLREELGVADGLADPQVYVLDPCCGTGGFLVEVLRHIAATLHRKGGDALGGDDLKLAAMQRVVGFEILPAPYVVAHLQLGLLLEQLGVAFSPQRNERAAVYLTNALTGWEPPTGPKQHLLYPELERERDAAEKVKREQPILVVLGNPPYNGYAGIAMAEERDLSTAYRTAKRAAAPQGQGLNDLYVRFFRMAERRIVEQTGTGIVCYISNYSWLDGLSFTGMRERYLEVFDRIWIDNLNGDKYKTGKVTPEGAPDPSVFSTDFNREGIQVGTAIALLTRTEQHTGTDTVLFRQLWGKTKRAQLLATATQEAQSLYQVETPVLAMGLPFLPGLVEADYLAWPLLPELFAKSFPGVKTSRDDVVIDIDRERLVRRMEQYFDPQISDAEFAHMAPGAMESTARFDAMATRASLRQRGMLPQNIVRYCYRPFDVRWLYWEPETKLLDEKRSDYFPHVFEGNAFLFTTGRTRKGVVEPALYTRLLNDLNCMDSGARGFPLYLHATGGTLFDYGGPDTPVPNLTDAATAYLASLAATEQELFDHCLGILHSPHYLEENTDALRHDWPRIPLPANKELLVASAVLGSRVAALLDTEQSVAGVTTAPIRMELRLAGVIARVGGGQLDPGAGELALRAGWGHRGQGGAVMPGRGRVVERPYTPDERAAIEAGAAEHGLSVEQALAQLGATTCDVYLNDVAYWRNIPERVWSYTIGGYQVIKKWLSYRERDLLGRDLQVGEARDVTSMARRIATMLLLGPMLDANYQAVKQAGSGRPVEAGEA